MKKVFFCCAVLFLVLAATAFASRVEIESALSSYEALVVEAETLAAKDLILAGDFSAMEDRASAAEAAVSSAVQNAQEWTIQDAKRSAELRARFNDAMAKAVSKLLQY